MAHQVADIKPTSAASFLSSIEPLNSSCHSTPIMVSPAPSSSPLSDGHLNGNNTLPMRTGPKLYGSNDGSQSGAGTPLGFQRHPHNKILDNVAGSSVRQPSPQPTHLAIPGGGQHRILSEEDPGYVAAKFEGKEKQMEQGEWNSKSVWFYR